MSPAAGGSLHLLLNAASIKRNQTAAPTVDAPEPAFARELIDLTTTMMAALNARDFEHPIFSRLAPRLRAYHDSTRDLIGMPGFANPPISSPETYIAAHRALIAFAPRLHWDVLRAVVVADPLDEQHGCKAASAKVWLFLRISGLGSELAKESVSVVTWRRRLREAAVPGEQAALEWQLCGHEGYRSVSGIV